MLATFIGLGVILRVSRLLHTPLMSLTNAISAIAVVGSIIVTGSAENPPLIRIYRRRRAVLLDDEHRQRIPDYRPHAENVQIARRGREALMEAIKQLSYLVATALFIFSLHWMNDPKTARRGVFAGAGGNAVGRSGHLVFQRTSRITCGSFVAIVAGLRVGLSAFARAAHGGAATNGAVARLRRIGRRAGRRGRVLHVARRINGTSH